MSDTSQDLEYHAINDLLPNDRTKFYTYSGSLTTPPCYEVVNWIVMHERVYINAKQVSPPSTHLFECFELVSHKLINIINSFHSHNQSP